MKSKKAVVETIDKQITVNVYSTNGNKSIRYPNQVIGTVALLAKKADGTEVVLKQWELHLEGETLKAKVVK